MRSWVNLCARRSSRSDISSAMSWARRAIFLRRAGLMALIFWFKVFIGSFADAYVVPSKPTRPILRSPAGVSDGPDGHYGFLFRIDDSKRESPEQKSPGVVLADRTAGPVGKNNTRRFLLWRFPFTIIYSEQESIVTIWAVAHA